MASTPLARERSVLTQPQEKLPKRIQGWIRGNAHLAAKLPVHPVAWMISDGDIVEVVEGDVNPDETITVDISRGERSELPDEIVEMVGVVGIDHRGNHRHVQVYQTREGARAYTNSILAGRDLLPCGHSGFRNLGDGEFTCAQDGCNAQYNRDTIEEVFG